MSSGDYLLGNTRSGNSDSSQAVCKLASDGTFKWIKRYDIYGGIHAIMEIGNQELLFAERRRDSVTHKNCPGFFKTDTAGNVLWGKYFNCDTGNVNMGGLIRTTDNMNVFVARQEIQSSLVAFAKIDDAGNILWIKKSGFLSTSVGGIYPIENGGILSLNGNYFNADYYYAVKFDGSGNQIWGKQYTFPGTLNLAPFGSAVLPNGNYIICCSSKNTGLDSANIILMEIDTAGTFLNAFGYNLSNQDFISRASMTMNSLGEMIVAFSIGFDFGFLLKVDVSRQPIWIDLIYYLWSQIKFVNDTDYVVTTPFSGDCFFLAHQRPSDEFTCYTPLTINYSPRTCTTTNYGISLLPQTYTEVAYLPVVTPDSITITNPCGVISDIPESNTITRISIFPNPVGESVSISNSEHQIWKENVEVFHADGHRMKIIVHQQDDEIKILTKDLKPGIYFVRIKTQDMVLTGKFVKE